MWPWLSWPRKQGIWKANLGCSGLLSLALSLPPSLPDAAVARRLMGSGPGPCQGRGPCWCMPAAPPHLASRAPCSLDGGPGLTRHETALLSSQGVTSLHPPLHTLLSLSFLARWWLPRAGSLIAPFPSVPGVPSGFLLPLGFIDI